MASRQFTPTTGTQWDWVVIALPMALVIRIVNPIASLLAIAVLVCIAIIRRPEGRFTIQAGPLLCFYVAVAIVFIRPDTYILPITALMVGILILKLITSVDARKLITSLIDGFGLLMLINVIGHVVGLESPVRKINAVDGRILYPLSSSVNYTPNAAAACFVAAIFLLRETGGRRRLFRVMYSAAAFIVVFSSGSRTALAVAVVLSAVAIFTPSASRWIGQFATVLAASSAFAFPTIMESIGSVITPLATLNPGRATDEAGILSFQGRAEIWQNVIKYWSEKINDPGDIALGFGQLGQYRSGVSSTYRQIVLNLVDPNPEYANVHNSFLEQLIDGGIIGWLFLFVAIFWASARLSTRRLQWGYFALAATFAVTTVLLGGTTEAFMAPGTCGESFWIVFFLVGIACQIPGDQFVPTNIKNSTSGINAT